MIKKKKKFTKIQIFWTFHLFRIFQTLDLRKRT